MRKQQRTQSQFIYQEVKHYDPLHGFLHFCLNAGMCFNLYVYFIISLENSIKD